MKSRITGRIEEWWKSVCRRRNCKYYLHEDYPSCSYCTCPDNCIVVKEYETEKKSQESEDKCSNCTKSWTDDCPRDKCWDNDYSEFIEESEINEWQK